MTNHVAHDVLSTPTENPGLILHVNRRGPEPVRAVDRDGHYLVEVYSAVRNRWILQAEHGTSAGAIADADSWY